MINDQDAFDAPFDQQCERLFREWDEAARSGDTEALLALYADDAVFETPLVAVVYPDRTSCVLKGKAEIGPFFQQARADRPEDKMHWHRTGRWLSDGKRLLAWEYPRQTPNGEQIDAAEFFEIEQGQITAHRVYFGSKGTFSLAPAIARKLAEETTEDDWHRN